MTELAASAGRLKANNIVVAMLSDGRERICMENTPQMFDAVRRGATIWTPEEMLRYVEMEQQERHVFRNLKQSFHATVEFKDAVAI